MALGSQQQCACGLGTLAYLGRNPHRVRVKELYRWTDPRDHHSVPAFPRPRPPPSLHSPPPWRGAARSVEALWFCLLNFTAWNHMCLIFLPGLWLSVLSERWDPPISFGVAEHTAVDPLFCAGFCSVSFIGHVLSSAGSCTTCGLRCPLPGSLLGMPALSVPVALCPCQHLVLSVLWILAIGVGM